MFSRPLHINNRRLHIRTQRLRQIQDHSTTRTSNTACTAAAGTIPSRATAQRSTRNGTCQSTCPANSSLDTAPTTATRSVFRGATPRTHLQCSEYPNAAVSWTGAINAATRAIAAVRWILKVSMTSSSRRQRIRKMGTRFVADQAVRCIMVCTQDTRAYRHTQMVVSPCSFLISGLFPPIPHLLRINREAQSFSYHFFHFISFRRSKLHLVSFAFVRSPVPMFSVSPFARNFPIPSYPRGSLPASITRAHRLLPLGCS
jgi:hypothetical protein